MFGRKQAEATEHGFQSPDHEHDVRIGREDIDPDSGVKRGLKNRHLSMMALAGIIGPGLLVGSGSALQNGGPASLIIGFGVIGIIAFSIMQSLGESRPYTLVMDLLLGWPKEWLIEALPWRLAGTTLSSGQPC